ncbi:hypothetical protein CERZMDRAFT_48729 [Cercospora zeae-maydis SCOH1-5]|uniref:Uncharacterized protein n=1 Tax=Cercospora zeae-maydis SCOH1-5 TaxID=717836 RepID=A0A6A6F7K5_9PEZI|nr:hypothetical protein CERZMDRAFT_48729 [Cercospora zeae-maydis SCOH1-5]
MEARFESGKPVVTLIVILASLALLPFVFRTLRQYWRLRRIPGPWQAKLTNFWLARKFWSGELFDTIARDLDERYGPVVAYGPNRVLFNDAAAINIIYNTRTAFPKAISYDVAIPVVNGKLVQTFITERDETKVAAVKKRIIGAFSTNALLDYEHHINRNIEHLLELLKVSELHKDINFATWNIYFAMDTICQIAFSGDTGLMDKQSDRDHTLEAGRERLQYWHDWRAVPWLEKLIHKNPWTIRRKQTSFLLARLAAERIQQRMEKGGTGASADLLDRYLQAHAKSPDSFTQATILGLTISVIAAGGETTSSTINVTLAYLLRNPHAMAKLQAEISEANLSFPPLWTEVNRLPYLDACIKEAGRLTPLLIDPLEREVPVPGAEISGFFVPAGTIVAVNTHAMNFEPKLWGPNTHEFRPERWIDCDEQQLKRMERANLFFAGGRRICVGEHIAWIEMKKYIPALLLKFNVSTADLVASLEAYELRLIATQIQAVHSDAPLHFTGSTNRFVDELMVRLTPR